MIITFKSQWLDDYYFGGVWHSGIPAGIESVLRRKLDILHTAVNEQDLRIPPGNRFEHLKGKLAGWCSIRVNRQYRLVFQWDSGGANAVYLSPHTYR